MSGGGSKHPEAWPAEQAGCSGDAQEGMTSCSGYCVPCTLSVRADDVGAGAHVRGSDGQREVRGL